MMIKKISILLLISIINMGLYSYSFTNNDTISVEEWPGDNWY